MTAGTVRTARSAALLRRVLPLYPLSVRRAGHLVHRDLLVARRVWLVSLSGLFEPFFYLLAIGVGVGQLVGQVVPDSGPPVTYPEFVAPGLMAGAAMSGAVYDSVANLFVNLRYTRLYDAVLATPLSAADTAVGEILWILLRGAVHSAAFLAVMSVLGLVGSWWAALALPAAVLIGFAFSAAGLAATTYMRGWPDFEFLNLVLVPLALFSTTFYPLSAYPGPLQVVVQWTPLYHGIELVRGLVTGDVRWALLGHAGYLFAMGLICLTIAARRLSTLLLK